MPGNPSLCQIAKTTYCASPEHSSITIVKVLGEIHSYCLTVQRDRLFLSSDFLKLTLKIFSLKSYLKAKEMAQC